jgi:predicted house-cleaning noncanonical NTP pyrophosphatase (MazG superfamily)
MQQNNEEIVKLKETLSELQAKYEGMKMQKSAETFLRNKDSELMDDMMELIDQFATGNVDLKFYQRIQRAYSRSVKER